MNFLKKLVISIPLILSATQLAAKGDPNSTQAIQQYIEQTSQQHNFKATELRELFSRVNINKKLVSYFHHAYEKKPWYQYRHLFLTKQRIQGGVDLWRQYQTTLQKAEQQYQIPASVIVAIIGIETDYGRKKGTFPVLDTLTTLAFYYPERAKFFRYELTEYLLLTREQHLATQTIKGSYAGAIGIPQFMPSTYRYYAVDNDGHHHADLVNDMNDSILSIANYLNKMGWQAGGPISQKLQTGNIPGKLVSTDGSVKHTLAELSQQGIKIQPQQDMQRKAAVIKLQTQVANYACWLIFHNFSVIMRYNTSINYAMAVNDLSEAIQHEYQRQTATTSPDTTPARQN